MGRTVPIIRQHRQLALDELKKFNSRNGIKILDSEKLVDRLLLKEFLLISLTTC